MERILRFFKWKADTWRKLANESPIPPYNADQTNPMLLAANRLDYTFVYQGKVAYAHRQAGVYDRLGLMCVNEWNDLKTRLGQMDGGDATVMIECM